MARFRFSFWLDSEKDDELLLMEDIDALKADRMFTKTIRDGIRLMIDLRRGSFDVLFELFPDARKHLRDDDNGGSGGDDLKAIKAQLERLEQVTLQQQAPQGYIMAARESGSTSKPSGPKPLNAPNIGAPVIDDDDDDLLTIKKDTSTDSGLNFIRSALALQGQ